MPKFQRIPIIIEAERLLIWQAWRLPDGTKIEARPGDWKILGMDDNYYKVPDRVFRQCYVPYDGDAEKMWRL